MGLSHRRVERGSDRGRDYGAIAAVTILAGESMILYKPIGKNIYGKDHRVERESHVENIQNFI